MDAAEAASGQAAQAAQSNTRNREDNLVIVPDSGRRGRKQATHLST